MNDLTIDEAIAFFRGAGFVVLTDEDFPLWGGDEDEGAEDDD